MRMAITMTITTVFKASRLAGTDKNDKNK